MTTTDPPPLPNDVLQLAHKRYAPRDRHRRRLLGWERVRRDREYSGEGSALSFEAFRWGVGA